jgi:hypothetical protein
MLTGQGFVPWIITAVVAGGAISAAPATGRQVGARGGCATWYLQHGRSANHTGIPAGQVFGLLLGVDRETEVAQRGAVSA